MNLYERACATKYRYIDRDLAQEVAERRSRMIGRFLGVYKCQFCGGWHLTSKQHVFLEVQVSAKECPSAR